MINIKDSNQSPWIINREYKDSQGNIHTEYKDSQGNIQTEYKDSQGNIHTEYKDSQGNIQTEYKDSQGNIHSYKNGYIDGHLAEEKNQDLRVKRADKNTSKGVLIGVIVTCVVGLSAGVIYFFTQQNNPQPVSIINVPTYRSTPEPSSSSPPPPVQVVEKPVVTIVSIPQPQKHEPRENATTQPSASNPSSKQGNINEAKPSTNSSASTPNSIVVSPPNNSVASSNLSTTDSNLKNEILKQFQNNLPNNQLTVDVKNGEVAVSGTVTTPEQLQQIQPLLKSIQGIGKVDMRATVAP